MPPACISLARITRTLDAVFLKDGGKSTQGPRGPVSQQGDIAELLAQFPDGNISGRGF